GGVAGACRRPSGATGAAGAASFSAGRTGFASELTSSSLPRIGIASDRNVGAGLAAGATTLAASRTSVAAGVSAAGGTSSAARAGAPNAPATTVGPGPTPTGVIATAAVITDPGSLVMPVCDDGPKATGAVGVAVPVEDGACELPMPRGAGPSGTPL